MGRRVQLIKLHLYVHWSNVAAAPLPVEPWRISTSTRARGVWIFHFAAAAVKLVTALQTFMKCEREYLQISFNQLQTLFSQHVSNRMSLQVLHILIVKSRFTPPTLTLSLFLSVTAHDACTLQREEGFKCVHRNSILLNNSNKGNK